MNRQLARTITLAVAISVMLAGCVSGSPSPTVQPAPGGPTPTASESPTAEAPSTAMIPTSVPTQAASAIPTTGPGPSRTPVPTAAGTPVATPTPRPASPIPTPVTTPVTTPPGVGQSVYVTAGSRTSKMVALTFDFGGRVGDALAIVNALADERVHATVFSTGDQANVAGTEPTVRQVFDVVCSTANSFALGNHSMTHPDFALLTTDQMKAQLTDAQAALASACPARSPLPFFRPPFGSLGGWRTATFYRILDAVGAVGYGRTVTWDVDTLDWGAPGTSDYRTTDEIVAKVETQVQGGSIVLMHLGGYNTYAAIQVLVPWLRSQGFALVDLHEMLGV